MTRSDPVVLSMSDRLSLGLTIYGEARSEPIEGQIAIGCVVRNRLRAGRGGHTVKDVCLAPKQFSCWNEGDPNLRILLLLAGGLASSPAVSDVRLRQSLWVADGIINQSILERVGSSQHYHTRGVNPAWSVGKVPDYAIGAHLFFEGIA